MEENLMRENEYVESEIVQRFINWLLIRVNQPEKFTHSYVIARGKISWECVSIYTAYKNYIWSFRYTDADGKVVSGVKYEDNQKALKNISLKLKNSIAQRDNEKCLLACREVLDWGGVKKSNYQKIIDMKNERCNYFIKVKENLERDESLDWYRNVDLYMSSGFTKIYSLIVRDFVIYDSRVGAALCYLVRKFCQESGLDMIPEELKFSWGVLRMNTKSKIGENPRNPNEGIYKFPIITNHYNSHLENNIRANWLVKELYRKDVESFGKLDIKDGLRAIEAALFMIGYKIRTE